MKTLVSIIIPVYNRENLIGETLESVLRQSYRNWECIVVDDRSNDKTIEVIESYCRKDSRFKMLIRPESLSKGSNVCRNIGFKFSKGNFIQWLDSDDLLGPKKLEEQIKVLNEDAKVSLTICKYGYFSNKNNLSVRSNVSIYKNYRNGLELLKNYGNKNEYFPSHVFLIKRDIINQAGLWDEKIIVNQDGEFFTRVLIKSGKIKFVNTQVYYRRIGGDNVSLINSKEKAQKLIDCWEVIQEHLTTVTGRKSHTYVEAAKCIILQRFKESYPSIVEENPLFFDLRKPFYKRILKLS